MAISRIELKDFMAFNGDFACDFSPGINVLIGGNGTGKTTLMKTLYWACEFSANVKIDRKALSDGTSFGELLSAPENSVPAISLYFFRDGRIDDSGDNATAFISVFSDRAGSTKPVLKFQSSRDAVSTVHIRDREDDENMIKWCELNVQSVFIPEKDLLSNSRGLPETYQYGNSQFTRCEIDAVKRARVLARSPEQPIYKKICDIIQGIPESDGESFFMYRNELNIKIPFAKEASGYRRLGLLALLIRNEQIRPSSVLFWDEPENSLNPELIPKLVEILLDLSHSGVQVFLASHNDFLCKWLELGSMDNDEESVRFISLYKENGGICAEQSRYYRSLEHNYIVDQSVELYYEHLRRATDDED